MKRRVVVTGMGAITPIGNGVEAFWEGIRQERIGFGPITKFDAGGVSMQPGRGGERL